MKTPEPLTCTLFLIVAFCCAGVLQILWLRSRLARWAALPIDGGRTFRGQRIFGDNKTWRGFFVMIPAVGGAFWCLAIYMEYWVPNASNHTMWLLSPSGYFLLGCWSGFAYMLFELPNSFVKRQLGILPGQPPAQPIARAICFLVDQADSVVGALLALAMFVPVPLVTWIVILLAGPVVHWLFNVVLMFLGLKTRSA
jgi:CDP-2,3-bis-(O-geranylgeranyl)-sn-glycerol synthase